MGRSIGLALIAWLALAGCGDSSGDGVESEPITFPVAYGPAWSADGGTIAFVALDAPGGGAHVQAVPARGGRVRRVTRQELDGIDDVVASPTRQELLITATDGELPGFAVGEILLMALADGQAATLRIIRLTTRIRRGRPTGTASHLRASAPETATSMS